MPDLMLDQAVKNNSRKLYAGFLIGGVVSLLFLVAVVSLAQYRLSRLAIIESVAAVLVEHIASEYGLPSQFVDERVTSQTSAADIDLQQLEASAIRLMQSHMLNSVVLVSRTHDIV